MSPPRVETHGIEQADCLEALSRLESESVDLVFADPPFNIGYEYDVHDDNMPAEQYVEWSKCWMSRVWSTLRPNGTFWLAIGDEYAAELCCAAKTLGYRLRSWVIWYYTFGANCVKNFTRSHTHLLYFVKDETWFTFNAQDPEVRVPSARQLVYGDSRANPSGRLPDNTWILRPQWVRGGLSGAEDTWHVPRVAGTFKERRGFPCQMPEKILGRIILTCSNPGDLVLDPFVGSGTTVAVAKKQGRRGIGFDVSETYVQQARVRVAAARPGDPLDGSSES